MALIRTPQQASFLATFLLYFRYIFVFLYPIALIPVAVVNQSKIASSAYLFLWMAGFWITGCISLYVTSFLPMFLGPVMGLGTSKALSKEYMPSSNMLMIASMTLAAAAEHTNLHRRIAMLFLRCMGFDARLIILGVMIPTWLLSMWMSNTSATLLMLTVTEAMLDKIENVVTHKKPTEDDDDIKKRSINDEEETVSINVEEVVAGKRDKWGKFGIGLSLGVAYASSCGGMATLIGTSANLVFAQLLESEYGPSTGFNFGTWIAYALPVSLIILVLTWLIICLMYLGPKETFSCKSRRRAANDNDMIYDEDGSLDLETTNDKELSLGDVVNEVIRDEQEALGSIKWAEGLMMGLFAAIILLWISREPGVPGWSQFMPTETDANGKITNYVDDTTPTILILYLAFTLPYNNPFQKWNPSVETYQEAKKRINEPLMPWSLAQSKGSWGVLILMGGGFALSLIIRTSGLTGLMGDALSGLGSLPVFGMVYLLTLIVSLATEMVSNTATVTIIVPIMFQLAQTIGINPMVISLPVVIAASCAFILPAATPPNAIIYAKGRMKLTDMILTGLVVNFAGQLMLTVCTMTYAYPLFNLGTFPDWANKTTRF